MLVRCLEGWETRFQRSPGPGIRPRCLLAQPQLGSPSCAAACVELWRAAFPGEPALSGVLKKSYVFEVTCVLPERRVPCASCCLSYVFGFRLFNLLPEVELPRERV